MCTCLFVVLTIIVTWLLGDTTFSRVGKNSGSGDQGPGTRGPTRIQHFLEFYIYTSQHSILVLGTSASSLANPLFLPSRHLAWCLHQLDIINASEKKQLKLTALIGHCLLHNKHTGLLCHLPTRNVVQMHHDQCWASYFLKVTSYILHITCN